MHLPEHRIAIMADFRRPCVYRSPVRPNVSQTNGSKFGSERRRRLGQALKLLPIAGSEVLALRKGTAPGGYQPFSAPDTAEPSGRGVWFHTDRFRDAKGPGTPEDKSPASRSNPREPLTRALPPHRTAVSDVFIRLQPSRSRRYCANTLFLGSE